MITADVTVARLLDEHPEALDVLVELHPHFKQLRNRLLRRLMAPRVTVAQAARIAGVDADHMLHVLRRAAGESTGSCAGAPDAPLGCACGPVDPAVGEGTAPRPAELDRLRPVHMDVRADIASGREPFARIMAALRGLGAGEAFVLRAPFEPIPLYDVLGKRGFSHWSECHGTADWSVWFYRPTDPVDTSAATDIAPAAGDAGALTLDVRGLEPPQPMVRVLQRLDALAAVETLVVIHDRRPLFLYPQLEDRGFSHETDEPEPGVVRIRIRRREP